MQIVVQYKAADTLGPPDRELSKLNYEKTLVTFQG